MDHLVGQSSPEWDCGPARRCGHQRPAPKSATVQPAPRLNQGARSRTCNIPRSRPGPRRRHPDPCGSAGRLPATHLGEPLGSFIPSTPEGQTSLGGRSSPSRGPQVDRLHQVRRSWMNRAWTSRKQPGQYRQWGGCASSRGRAPIRASPPSVTSSELHEYNYRVSRTL